MEHIKNYWNFYLIGAIVLVWVIWRLGFKNSATAVTGTDNGSLASCIKSKGAKFYGASWCPHCNSQKKTFGSDAVNLPYVECSDSIGGGQAQVCIDAGITGYPTWVFADGTKRPGEMSKEQLKQKTGC